jgi:hypothetical protein
MNSTLAPITHRVSRWSGVDTDSSHDGETFRVGGRTFAHLSRRGSLTVPTTPALRDQLLTDGFADSVPGVPALVRYRVRSPADVPGAIRLARVAYLQHAGPRERAFDADTHLRRLGASTELAALLVGPRAGGPGETSA